MKIKSNQYFKGGKAHTYYYIEDKGLIYHHKDNKWRKKPLKEITTYWYKTLVDAEMGKLSLTIEEVLN